MKSINCGMIVSDFDGTLVQKDGRVSEKNIAAINDYIAAGGIFVISTGRVPAGILPQAKKMGLKGLISCCQGTIILDIETERVVFEDRLSFEASLAACRKMEEMGLHIHAYDLWEYYCNMDDEYLEYYERVTGTKAKLITDKRMSDFIEEKKLSAYKLLTMLDPKDNARVLKELSEAGLPNSAVTKSSAYLVEVVNPNCSKGSAIKLLAKHYGIAIENTVGIGDNFNDITMIETAGIGVAVGNAEEELKARAKYVCKSTNEQSAIAEVIEKFGFLKD